MKNKIEKYGMKKVHTKSQIQASGTQTGWRYRIVLLPCPSCLPSYVPQSVCPWWPDRLARAPVLPPAPDNKPFWLPNDLAFPRVKVQHLKRTSAHSHKNGISPLSSIRVPSSAVSQSRGFWEPAFWSHCQSLPKLQQSLPTIKLDLKVDSVCSCL